MPETLHKIITVCMCLLWALQPAQTCMTHNANSVRKCRPNPSHIRAYGGRFRRADHAGSSDTMSLLRMKKGMNHGMKHFGSGMKHVGSARYEALRPRHTKNGTKCCMDRRHDRSTVLYIATLSPEGQPMQRIKAPITHANDFWIFSHAHSTSPAWVACGYSIIPACVVRPRLPRRPPPLPMHGIDC
jgi:hypothetical protein